MSSQGHIKQIILGRFKSYTASIKQTYVIIKWHNKKQKQYKNLRQSILIILYK